MDPEPADTKTNPVTTAGDHPSETLCTQQSIGIQTNPSRGMYGLRQNQRDTLKVIIISFHLHMHYINCTINNLEAQVDRKEFTKDMGVQCIVLSGVLNVRYTNASVQCETPTPLTTSTSPHYLAESSESELSQIDVEDAHAM